MKVSRIVKFTFYKFWKNYLIKKSTKFVEKHGKRIGRCLANFKVSFPLPTQRLVHLSIIKKINLVKKINLGRP